MHNIHAHVNMAALQKAQIIASSLDDLREKLIKTLGEFPILFYGPSTVEMRVGEPGIVLTALVDIPGVADRVVRPPGLEQQPLPFLGAQMVGYVPAAKNSGPIATGEAITTLGILKTPDYFKYTQPTTVEKPYDGPEPEAR